ncbi:hypothetical protein BC829DRAFT_429699 [Chytridium lagenaria]|nr:hypothetical protein BC829DRAFT_429699 [Chytridium lagenaria]
MSWSRYAILVVVLIAALLNVVVGVSVPTTGADIDGRAVSQVKHEALLALNSAPVAAVSSSQAVVPLPMESNKQVQLQRRAKATKAIPVVNTSMTEGPLGGDITTALKHHFKELFQKSIYSKAIVQEMGGWVYADSANPRSIMFVDAPKDRSKPSKEPKPEGPKPKGKGKGKGKAEDNEREGDISIMLNNPLPGGVPANWVLVANYHTHPSEHRSKMPSKADVANAFKRGVPGIVISSGGIYVYGPERRVNLNPATKFYPMPGTTGVMQNKFPIIFWSALGL